MIERSGLTSRQERMRLVGAGLTSRARRAGARGYLLKDAGPDELAAAIRTVHQGGSLVQPVMASRLLDRFGDLATRERLPESLTEREGAAVAGHAVAGLSSHVA